MHTIIITYQPHNCGNGRKIRRAYIHGFIMILANNTLLVAPVIVSYTKKIAYHKCHNNIKGQAHGKSIVKKKRGEHWA